MYFDPQITRNVVRFKPRNAPARVQTVGAAILLLGPEETSVIDAEQLDMITRHRCELVGVVDPAAGRSRKDANGITVFSSMLHALIAHPDATLFYDGMAMGRPSHGHCDTDLGDER